MPPAIALIFLLLSGFSLSPPVSSESAAWVGQKYGAAAEEDTLIAIAVRDPEFSSSRKTPWCRIKFKKCTDGSWHILTSDQFPDQEFKEEQKYSWTEGKNVIDHFDFKYDPNKHCTISRTESDGDVVITLTGTGYFPPQCEQPDISLPIALPFGPNPSSTIVTHFVALSQTDIEVRFFDYDLEEISRVSFSDVPPGPYFLNPSDSNLPSGGYRIQIWNSNKLVVTLVWVN